jgi:hypothetical protein
MYPERFCNISQPTGPHIGRKREKRRKQINHIEFNTAEPQPKREEKNFTAENAKDAEERDFVGVFYVFFTVKLILVKIYNNCEVSDGSGG